MNNNTEKKAETFYPNFLSGEELRSKFSDRQIEILKELSPLAKELKDLSKKVMVESEDLSKQEEMLIYLMRKITKILRELNKDERS